MRGRNRNKGPNPLTRAYESNGPDVKIRGTAQHIADKYAQLARDAQASGDPVAAENYFQHAEHYYRIIAAAQEQYRQQYGGTFQRPNFDEDGEEGDDEMGGQGGYGDQRPGGQGYGGDDYGDNGQGPQPYEAGQDRGGPDRGQQDRGQQDRGNYEPRRFDRRDDRRDRFQGQGRNDRNDRQDQRRFDGPRQDGNRQDGSRQEGNRQDGPRHEGMRQDGPRQDGPRQDGPRFDQSRQENGRGDVNRDDQPRQDYRRDRARDDEVGPQHGLPAFLTAPVRSAPMGESGEEPTEGGHREAAPGDMNGQYSPRPRRRRRTRYEGPAGEAEGGNGGDLASEAAGPSGD